MALKIEISNERYENLKKEVLDGTFIKRIDVKLSDVTIESLNKIKISGKLINLSVNAVSGLAETLGISKKFIETLRKAYGENEKILNLIVKAIKGQKVNSITLVYNSKLEEVVNIYPTGSKLISDTQYFEALEGVLRKTPGAYLRNIIQTTSGDLNAVIANPELEFQFGNLSEEVFTSGITLDLDESHMNTSFFTERLVCSNGMTTRNKLTSRNVRTSEKVPDFLTAILDADYHINSITEFKRRLNRCYHTTASLAEVLSTSRKVENTLGNYAPVLMSDMSVNRLKMVFGDTYLKDNFNHEFLKTDITLWELINEVTALSARVEQNRIAIPGRANLALQMAGGDLLFSKPDLSPSNIKQLF